MKTLSLLCLLLCCCMSCTTYEELDYHALCIDECKNGRYCFDGTCACPPNSYELKTHCQQKHDTIFHAVMDTAFACGKQLLIHVSKSDITTFAYPGVVLQLENGSLEFNWNGLEMDYFKLADGDSIHTRRMSFSNDSCWPTRKAIFHAKFKGKGSLLTWFYFYDENVPGIKDSLKIIFTR